MRKPKPSPIQEGICRRCKCLMEAEKLPIYCAACVRDIECEADK